MPTRIPPSRRTLKTMKLAALPLAAFLLQLVASSPAAAQIALAAKAGSLGLGAELHAGLGPTFNLRLGLNQYDYTSTRKESGIDYDAKAELRSTTLLLDWFPFPARGFRVTAGAMRNGTEVNGRSLPPPNGIYVIGGVPIPASQLGTLRANVDFDPTVPYAGIGWGNAVRRDHRLAFYLDLGVVFQGRPQVRLSADLPPGSPLNLPVAREALNLLLQSEAKEIEDDLKDYDKYPVVALGLAYRF